MIVIPQLFNYRLIIGSLVLAILVLGSYSFLSYNELEGKQEFLEQEQKLVSQELSQMISLYNALEEKNNNLKEQLIESKLETQEVKDSLKLIKTNESVVVKYKSQIQSLKSERNQLKKQLEQVAATNKSVIAIKPDAENSKPKKEISKGTTAKTELNETAISVSSFHARALTKSVIGKQVETKKAKRVNHLEVCITLSKSYSDLDEKDLYIQILNPQNNIVSDKGAVSFGNSSLIFSKKTSLNKLDSDNNICETVKADRDETFVKGFYFVNLFHKDKLIENTSIQLN